MTDRASSCSNLRCDRRSWLLLMLGSLASPFAYSADAPLRSPVRVGFISHYQPYSFVGNDGSVTGFDVEVVRSLLSAQNLELTPVLDTFANLHKRLQTGDISFIGNQLLVTPENRRRFDFVKSYASIQLVSVLHESDDRDLLSLDDFVGKKLGVLANTEIEDQVRGALGNVAVAFEKIETAFTALSNRQLDAVIEENLIADYFIELNNLPLKVGVPFAPLMRVGLAVQKGRKDLETHLSSGIEAFVKQMDFKKISQKWFGYDVSRPRVAHSMGEWHEPES